MAGTKRRTRGGRVARQQQYAADVAWPTDRRLVVVDVENVVGGPCTTAARVEWAHRRVLDTIGARPGDHVVVGADAGALACVAFAWSRARYVAGYGENGADLALVEVLQEHVADRFSSVVVASGDGIFTDLVTELTRRGVHVTVVAHERALSRRLRLAASEVRLLSHLGRVPSQRSA